MGAHARLDLVKTKPAIAINSNTQGRRHITLEVCVDSPASVRAAVEGGAHRLELCSNLLEGGTTPGPGLVDFALQQRPVDLMMMVRPRGGDFLYDEDEFETMKHDISFAHGKNLQGVVFGILTPDAEVDQDRTAELVKLAGAMEVTFHRAFDMTTDPRAALETLIDVGVTRVLTSGQCTTAFEGRHLIRELVEQAVGRIEILPGSGIDPDNAGELVAYTGADQIHGSASTTVVSSMAAGPDGGAAGKQGRSLDVVSQSMSQTSTTKVKEMIAVANEALNLHLQ